MSIKGYLFECPENDLVHRRLSTRAWDDGAEVMLPPMRVTRVKTKMYGQYFIVYMKKPPVAYKGGGWLPKRKYRLEQSNWETWKLKIVK